MHHWVPNMPALVARTGTLALTRATLPYMQALAAAAGLSTGLQVWDGGVCHPGIDADAALPVRRWP